MKSNHLFSGLRTTTPDFPFRLLMAIFGITGIGCYRWLTDHVIPKGLADFEQHLGTDFLQNLPKITSFVFDSYLSPYWQLIIPIILLLSSFVVFVRSSWISSLGGLILGAILISLPTIVFMALWAGNAMLVNAIASAAKAKGLIN